MVVECDGGHREHDHLSAQRDARRLPAGGCAGKTLAAVGTEGRCARQKAEEECRVKEEEEKQRCAKEEEERWAREKAEEEQRKATEPIMSMWPMCGRTPNN